MIEIRTDIPRTDQLAIQAKETELLIKVDLGILTMDEAVIFMDEYLRKLGY